MLNVILLLLASASADDTSLGHIGDALQALSEQVEELSTKLNTTLSQLTEKINDSITVTESLSLDEFEVEIDKAEEELWYLDREIEDLEAEIQLEVDVCEDAINCKGCVETATCVWCPSLKTCVPGDSAGPFDNECAGFEYEHCSTAECSYFEYCDMCLEDTNCGWCLSSGTCMEGSRYDSGTCELGDFYQAYVESRSECPSSAPMSYKVSAEESVESSAETEKQKERDYNRMNSLKSTRVEDLKAEYAAIEAQITDLRAMEEEVQRMSSQARESEVTGEMAVSSQDTLGEDVDDQYSEERAQMHQFLSDTANNETESELATIESEVEGETDAVNAAQQDTKSSLSTEIEELSSSNGGALESILDMEEEIETTSEAEVQTTSNNNDKLEQVSSTLETKGYTFMEFRSFLMSSKD